MEGFFAGFMAGGMTMNKPPKAILMDAAMIDRALTRIAHEILEKNKALLIYT
jgi:hypothetical protein